MVIENYAQQELEAYLNRMQALVFGTVQHDSDTVQCPAYKCENNAVRTRLNGIEYLECKDGHVIELHKQEPAPRQFEEVGMQFGGDIMRYEGAW